MNESFVVPASVPIASANTRILYYIENKNGRSPFILSPTVGLN